MPAIVPQQDLYRIRSLIISSLDQAPEAVLSRRIWRWQAIGCSSLKLAAKPKTRITLSPPFIRLSTEDQDLQWNYFVRHYANDNRQNNDTKRDKNGRASGIREPARWEAARHTMP